LIIAPTRLIIVTLLTIQRSERVMCDEELFKLIGYDTTNKFKTIKNSFKKFLKFHLMNIQM
jgi:hypothetical protein